MLITDHITGEESAIVSLLKQSLGESLLPKSEAYWKWKHTDNFFGPSKVILAKEGDELIGVRAFMRWEWQRADARITAVRAVDTATHPAYQGKGIFRKLTMQAVDECKAEGVKMVFNSPNPKSMAGYLTMGWQLAGRMPMNVSMGSLFPRSYDESFASEVFSKYPVSFMLNELGDDWIYPAGDSLFQTPLTAAYLKWRYHLCPVATYGCCGTGKEFGFVFRLKRIGRFFELRICDIWYEQSNSLSPQAVRSFKALLKFIRPAIVTMAAGTPGSITRQLSFWLSLRRGPLTTVRPLAENDLSLFLGFKHWAPSTGSMELF